MRAFHSRHLPAPATFLRRGAAQRCLLLLTVGALGGTLVSAPAAAQRPIGVGSAAGLGLTGVTEARLGESALFNPALVGLYDGPARSYSYPGIVGHVSRPRPVLQMEQILAAAKGAPRLVRGDAAAGLLHWAGTNGVAGQRAEGAVQWLALTAPTVGLSLSSYGNATVALPARAAAILAAQPAALVLAPSAQDSADARSARSAFYRATAAAFAKSSDAGILPWFGHTWFGVAAKASLVHQAAHVGWEFQDAARLSRDSLGASRVPGDAQVQEGQTGALRTEIGVRNVMLYGVDVGMVAVPTPSLVVGVALANAYQRGGFDRGAAPAYRRVTSVVGRTASGHAYAINDEVRIDGRGVDSSWFAAAAREARDAHFTPLARVGLAYEGTGTRIVMALAQRVGPVGLDYEMLDQWTAGVIFTDRPARPRLSYARRFDGAGVFNYGVEYGTCGRRVGVSLGYAHAKHTPGNVEFGLSLARGLAPCALPPASGPAPTGPGAGAGR